MSNIAVNVEAVYERIRRAAQRTGRDPAEITLVAVTKTHPLKTVESAYRTGLRHFGENRVEEGAAKVTGLNAWRTANSEIEAPHWHFIGHLQSRQVEAVLSGQFNLIHSVHTLKLAQRLDRLAERDNHSPVEVLLQCNVSGEETKSGFMLNSWRSSKQQLSDFCQAISQIGALDNISIKGLMTMAPFSANPEDTRPSFQSLAALKEEVQSELPHIDWQHLSMGMTDDFEVAIEQGATIVRVGRAIFGERPLL